MTEVIILCVESYFLKDKSGKHELSKELNFSKLNDAKNYFPVH